MAKSLMEFFGIESKEAAAERRRKYEILMFPFAEEQRKWERMIIEQTFPNKLDHDTLLYALLCYREMLIKSRLRPEDPEYVSLEEGEMKWLKDKAVKRIKPERREILKRIAEHELASGSMEEMKAFAL